jgi:hypothetical protein
VLPCTPRGKGFWAGARTETAEPVPEARRTRAVMAIAMAAAAITMVTRFCEFLRMGATAPKACRNHIGTSGLCVSCDFKGGCPERGTVGQK